MLTLALAHNFHLLVSKSSGNGTRCTRESGSAAISPDKHRRVSPYPLERDIVTLAIFLLHLEIHNPP